ncbi:MAG: hypothetical protein COA97_10505 [Flavobacteriales bacterium]|nr:MAG: hypothetical protein COA97_10505 [Flavobacteriales bacterium]
MKKLYTILAILLCCNLLSIAQPTLTSSNYIPFIGDAQLYYIADTNSVVAPIIGANVTFNYAGIRGYGQTQTQYIVDPTTTTYTSDFLTATYTDTTGGFPINKNYKKTELTDSLTNIGLVADISTYGTVIIKYDQDPETIMKFPFNYTDNYADAYSGTFTVQGVNTIGNGTATVIADAWGTLLLPNNISIDSVLRIKTIEYLITDTIFITVPIPITILPVEINAEYINYYKPSISKFPLLSFVSGTYTQDNNTLDSSRIIISQYPMYGVGIDELNENIDVNISPNPTNKNYTTLSFELANNASVIVTVFNNLGQKVSDVFNGNLEHGENKLKVLTANLSKGLYFISVRIDKKTITKKMIIE